MRRALLFVVAIGFGGCFSPSEPICSFQCSDSDPKCPMDYTCASDGYCHLAGHESESCGFSDASVPPDLAPPNDLSIVDMPPATGG
jgi:hypothetical protein